MRSFRGSLVRAHMLAGIAAVAIVSPAQAGAERTRHFDLPAQSAEMGIPAFAKQAGLQIVANGVAVRGKRTNAVRGQQSVAVGLQALLAGTGLIARGNPDGKGIITIVAAPATSRISLPVQDVPVASDPGAVASQDEEIIVTAQKREEKIIDVPVAITALSAKAMDDRKIEGGSELLRAVPNVNFSKNNFSTYNFSIRGVGTKATSASSDPAVAVSFNNAPLTRNRLFESEFLDLERVEVLRGPQGTLYGRNTTAGVVNMIPALPKPDFGMDAKIEVGNYKTMRATGMLNVPITDTLGIRVAGQWTNRDGFDYNTVTGRRVNGRDLYTTRATLAWEPSDRFRVNAVWQHFNENDDRSRTGKQLCNRDDPPESLGTPGNSGSQFSRYRFSQGCLPTSLYGDNMYQAPSGYTLAYYNAVAYVVAGYELIPPRTRNPIYAIKQQDPWGNVTITKNLREISTVYDPKFRAKNNLFQANLEFEPVDGIKLVSQTTFTKDSYYSTQDFNRVDTGPIFNASDFPGVSTLRGVAIDTSLYPGVTPGGKFCDPQLGCSDRGLAVDLSISENEQWYQEFRIQSDFSGSVNFNIGANYLSFKTNDKYYVFNNMFTMVAQYLYAVIHPVTSLASPRDCPLGFEGVECIYVDPNPLTSVNDQGHNYFLSKNGVKSTSKALFGELYWQASDDLKITLGGRYTDDRKNSTQIPSQLLLAGGTQGVGIPGASTGGKVNSGYPAAPNILQKWGEFTGRAVVDWKPNLSFTDDTLVYLSASHGYKGGGTNPPRVDINPAMVRYQPLEETFRPEYVNAFELGIKNSFANGRMTFNATAFYYDYKDYQVSQIVDRIAYNENFDAKSYGLEFEAAWRPSRRWRFDSNVGLLRTRLGNGQGSIDVMNRTAGNPDWVVLRPWVQTPSNCIAPKVLADRITSHANYGTFGFFGLTGLCPGSNRVGDFIPETAGGLNLHSFFGFTYDPMRPYDPTKIGLNIADGSSGAPNFARGFETDISGHELPNAPRFTFNFGAEHMVPIGPWELTLRGDYYRQSASWTRIYNTEYDRLRAWDNANLSVTLRRPESGFTAQLYVKNVFNKTPITDAFTNSDDTGLTTNIFTLDPRIVGFSLRKSF
ncbi:MAG: TonB-dependent receptor [Sphingomonadales bacterium]|nr:MAG: TonB-dependent receptor [Sphingomonadales bacterium]